MGKRRRIAKIKKRTILIRKKHKLPHRHHHVYRKCHSHTTYPPYTNIHTYIHTYTLHYNGTENQVRKPQQQQFNHKTIQV